MTECLMSSGYVMTAFNTTIITAFSKTKSTIMHENNESIAVIGLTVGVSLIVVFYLVHVCLLIVGILLAGQLLENKVSEITPVRHIPPYGPMLADSSYYGLL